MNHIPDWLAVATCVAVVAHKMARPLGNPPKWIKALLGLTVLSLPLAAQPVTLYYDGAAKSIEKTVAKVIPSDMHGYLAQACNWNSTPAQFNPAWWLAKAHGHVRPQSPALVLVAAADARQGGPKAMIYRGTLLGGGIVGGLASGGLIAIPQITKLVALGFPILAPFVKDGYGRATKIDKPTDWIATESRTITLAPGDCMAGTFAAAKGGEESFVETAEVVKETLTSQIPIKEIAPTFNWDACWGRPGDDPVTPCTHGTRAIAIVTHTQINDPLAEVRTALEEHPSPETERAYFAKIAELRERTPIVGAN